MTMIEKMTYTSMTSTPINGAYSQTKARFLSQDPVQKV
jgi:hypothetical protein